MTSKVITADMPVNLDLKPLKIGQDYPFTITFKDDNLDPQDTTGWDMQIKGRANNPNGEEIFNLTVGSGITHTPGSGRFDVKITDTITALFDVGVIAWDCKVTDSNGDVWYPLEGKIKVLETVTR